MPPERDEPVAPPLEDEDPPPAEPPELEDVEYFVDVLEVEPGVFTSVPNPVQLEQTCSFAPSTLMVVGDDVSAPHISH